MADRILNVKLLKDGTERCLIHWLMPHADGPIHTSGGEPGEGSRKLKVNPFSGRIACRPTQNSVNPRLVNGEHQMCLHSDDVRGASCPDCLATPEALAVVANYKRLEEQGYDDKMKAAIEAAAIQYHQEVASHVAMVQAPDVKASGLAVPVTK